jgi:hypothetical protein
MRRAYPPASHPQAAPQVEDDDLIAVFLREGEDDLDKLRDILFASQMHQHRPQLVEQDALILLRDGMHHLFLRAKVEVEGTDDHPRTLSDIGQRVSLKPCSVKTSLAARKIVSRRRGSAGRAI